MRIIAFSGPKYCGKDTAAKGLLRLNAGDRRAYFRRAPMAEGVKEICKIAFGYTDLETEDPILKETKTTTYPFVEPRWPMMDIANWFRSQYGGEVWAKRWERVTLAQADAFGCHVMTDLRFPEELEMLKRLNGMIVYVDRAEAEAALRAKRSSGNAMALNVSESHYGLIRDSADFVVENNGTIAQLHDEVESLVKGRWGHWHHWNVPNILEGRPY
jgi:hypothetical protein